LIVAYGITARAARRARREVRQEGLKVGLFRPITIWPFPEEALRQAAAQADHVLVPEMNAGQLVIEIERLLPRPQVLPLNRIDGEPIGPAEIAARVRELAR
jgi:2-oxoglutarate ferredoxin oxidoreductase subunit alpha